MCSDTIGFINVTVPGSGEAMIACQLICPGGNTIASLLTNVPGSTTAYKWDVVSQGWDTYTYSHGAWPSPSPSLNPGEGIDVENFTSNAFTITFIGLVPSSPQSLTVATNASIVSSVLPLAAGLDVLGFPAVNGDQVSYWNTTTEETESPLFSHSAWSGGAPVPSVGEAFWIISNTSTNRTWIENFNISP
jgi:hypothetical protein